MGEGQIPDLPPSSVGPPAIRILWPEMAPEAVENLDNESAVIAERRAKVFRLYTQGLTIREIAEHPTVKASKSTVGRDVQHVAESYRLIALQDAAAHLAREIGRLGMIEAAAWESFERSRGESVESTTGRRDLARGVVADAGSATSARRRPPVPGDRHEDLHLAMSFARSPEA